MFRLIFVVLLSLFSTLAWIEAGTPAQQHASIVQPLSPEVLRGQGGDWPERLFVAADAAFLRTGASAGSPSVAMLPLGAPVQVIGGLENGYIAVADGEGHRGYIAGRLLTPMDPGAPAGSNL